MADIIDSDSTNDELNEFDNVDNLSSTEPTVQTAPEDDLPEKFKGKSMKDIVKAYEEVEKLAGRQAQEVGELRKLTDEILKNQLKAQTQPEPQAQEVDFFDDPKEAVNKVVENHPAVKAAKETAALLKAQEVKQKLVEKHGDPEQFGKDPEFIEWVKGSKVRMALAAAAQNYDYDAADELMTTYKEIKAVKAAKQQEQAQELQAKQKQSLKAASVDMASGTGESSKKIYRRADLIRLMQTDPKRYEALQPEIMAAYQEGRVK
jgi:hypothetical protein